MNPIIDTKISLSLMWTVVMINMIFADIFSLVIEVTQGQVFAIPGEVATMMLIAAFLTNIPILMILLSYCLAPRASRLANLVAAPLTIVYVVGGGVALPHYMAIATLEVLICLVIFIKAWRWQDQQATA